MSDETTPVPASGTKAAQLHWTLRALAKYLPPILLAAAAFVGAIQVGGGTAKEASKDAVDTSLQATKKPVDELQTLSRTMGERITRLEADLAALRRLVRNARMSETRKARAEAEALAAAAAVKAAAPVAPKLTPVPDSLDKAQQQQGAAK